jgi:hypothetical protein
MIRAAALAAALALGTVLLVIGTNRGSAGAEAVPCDAAQVHGAFVRAGRFTGAITPEYDVLDGRFRLRVGRYRDATTSLTQKIPWSISRRADVGRRLRIDAERLPPFARRTFHLKLRRTSATGDRTRWFFPSIVRPPAEGCWRLRFRSGQATGRLTVLVRG